MSEAKVLGEPFLALLQRHIINIMCFDGGPAARSANGGKRAVYNFSAFVVEIGEEWVAISAGHIFNDLKDAVSRGAELSEWHIDDSIVSTKPERPYPISLDIHQDVHYIYNDVPGMDYAYIKISYLVRAALSKQGICAVPESIWGAEDIEQFSMWLLIGTPIKFAHLVEGEAFEKSHATIQIDRVHDVPKGLEDTKFQRLYAKVDFSSVMDQESRFDIDGMSGGPIFGLRPSTDTAPYEYRLIGIQSSWNTKDHVAICAAYPYLRAIANSLG